MSTNNLLAFNDILWSWWLFPFDNWFGLFRRLGSRQRFRLAFDASFNQQHFKDLVHCRPVIGSHLQTITNYSFQILTEWTSHWVVSAFLDILVKFPSVLSIKGECLHAHLVKHYSHCPDICALRIWFAFDNLRWEIDRGAGLSWCFLLSFEENFWDTEVTNLDSSLLC